MHSIWKSPKILHLSFSILPFPTIVCPIDIYLSGSTLWPQALGFQKWTIFGIFNELHSKCNHMWNETFFSLFKHRGHFWPRIISEAAFKRKMYILAFYLIRHTILKLRAWYFEVLVAHERRSRNPTSEWAHVRSWLQHWKYKTPIPPNEKWHHFPQSEIK